MGPLDGRAGDDDGRGAPVVADGQVCVVWLQGVRWSAEHAADVVGVVSAGVEVGVVAYLHRQVHCDVGPGDEAS